MKNALAVLLLAAFYVLALTTPYSYAFFLGMGLCVVALFSGGKKRRSTMDGAGPEPVLRKADADGETTARRPVSTWMLMLSSFVPSLYGFGISALIGAMSFPDGTMAELMSTVAAVAHFLALGLLALPVISVGVIVMRRLAARASRSSTGGASALQPGAD